MSGVPCDKSKCQELEVSESEYKDYKLYKVSDVLPIKVLNTSSLAFTFGYNPVLNPHDQGLNSWREKYARCSVFFGDQGTHPQGLPYVSMKGARCDDL